MCEWVLCGRDCRECHEYRVCRSIILRNRHDIACVVSTPHPKVAAYAKVAVAHLKVVTYAKVAASHPKVATPHPRVATHPKVAVLHLGVVATRAHLFWQNGMW